MSDSPGSSAGTCDRVCWAHVADDEPQRGIHLANLGPRRAEDLHCGMQSCSPVCWLSATPQVARLG
jgi:hypothetical protein